MQLGVLLLHPAVDIRRASAIIGAIAGTVVVLGLCRFIDRSEVHRCRLRCLR